METLSPNRQGIERAAFLLGEGKVVALPTETVYGLAARAADLLAVAKIFEAKGRPADHPLIVHIRGLEDLSRYAIDIPALAYTLADAFWPGPLTFVLKAAPEVSPLITGGQTTVAIRWSGHPIFQEVLDTLGEAVVAPSANPFGHISPTSAMHVQKQMEGRIDAVLDGGDCQVGVESTILDLSEGHPRILRPGLISAEALSPYLTLGTAVGSVPRVPGALESHYAPRKPCFRFEADEKAQLVGLPMAGRCIYIGFDAPAIRVHQQIGLPKAPHAYARELYRVLHEAESMEGDFILIEMPPESPEWLHVRDRLIRASRPI